MQRSLPNVLITGTPATGKSTICDLLQQQRSDLNVVNVSKFAKDNNLYDGYDQELECNIIDEDALIEKLSPLFEDRKGGIVIDFHGCDLFPEKWFDRIFVVRTSNTSLYDRLSSRGYSETKLKNNLECEIFQTILDEAKEAFDEDIVEELHNETEDDIVKNVDIVKNFIDKWTNDR